MKRALIASILGIAASVVTSYGQGTVAFNNYFTFGSAGAQIFESPAMTPIGTGLYNISLYYQLGTVASPVATGTLIATTLSGSGGTGAGYYDGSNVLIPNYPSAGGAAITFQVVATGIGAKLGWTGTSVALPLGNIATGPTPPGNLDIPSFNVIIPEPSTFALAGLGAAAMLIFRRRK
jgi:hypothetical protein